MDTEEFYTLVHRHFSLEELRTLCLFMNIDYEKLPGEGKEAMVRELIRYCVRRKRFEELVGKCESQRPDVEWRDTSALDQLPPPMQVHSYSGKWEIETNFVTWRGISIAGDDKVTFRGVAFLQLSAAGDTGYGTQGGRLDIAIGNSRATFLVMNRINDANVSKRGALHMEVEVRERELITPEEEVTDPWLLEALPEPKFTIDLGRVRDEPHRLEGRHANWDGKNVFQAAVESYTWVSMYDS